MNNKNLISYIIFIITLLSSCNNKSNNILSIDLEKNNNINYSDFVKSLDYIELNTNDTCLISEIERIYLDDDTICILDRKRGGVFTFTVEGKLISQINYYGEGPKEFIDINSFSIDPTLNQICIFDISSKEIKKYSYKGEFIKSYKTDFFVRDFTIFNNEINLFILPYYAKKTKYGIWTTDTNNNIIKELFNDIPKDDKFEFCNTYFNRYPEGIFYYDRNYDQISYITPDTLFALYKFDLKQRLRNELRIKDPSTFQWEDFAMMWNFSITDQYLLLTYYYYGKDIPYKWVLIDRKTNQLIVSDHLTNDLDQIPSDDPSVFYLDKNLWCRVVKSSDVNNCNIILQLMNIK